MGKKIGQGPCKGFYCLQTNHQILIKKWQKQLNDNLSYLHGCIIYYSCGLSTATIMYSCLSVCVSVCVSVCRSVCVHDNSKNNGSIHFKLEHIVVYENSSDEFDIGHFPIMVKVTA